MLNTYLKRTVLLGMVTVLALVAQKPAPRAAPKLTGPSALDKSTLEVWVRHYFVWPAPIQIQIEDPKPGPLPDLYSVLVRGISGSQMQEETFYISKDGKKIIRGTAFETANNPFKPAQSRARPTVSTSHPAVRHGNRLG